MAISFRWSGMEPATEGGRDASIIITDPVKWQRGNFRCGCITTAKTAQWSGYPTNPMATPDLMLGERISYLILTLAAAGIKELGSTK